MGPPSAVSIVSLTQDRAVVASNDDKDFFPRILQRSMSRANSAQPGTRQVILHVGEGVLLSGDEYHRFESSVPSPPTSILSSELVPLVGIAWDVISIGNTKDQFVSCFDRIYNTPGSPLTAANNPLFLSLNLFPCP